MIYLNQKDREKWERTRSKGKLYFVIVYWVLLWGITTTILVTIFNFAISFLRYGPEYNFAILFKFFIFLPFFMVGGYFGGRWIWKRSELEYRKGLSNMEEGKSKNMNKKIKIGITIILIILIITSSYTYWFVTRKNRVEFYFHWNQPFSYMDYYLNETGEIIFNQSEVDANLIVDNDDEYTITIDVESWPIPSGIEHYKKLITFLKWGNHKININYYNKTLSISETIFISETTYILIYQTATEKLHIETSNNKPINK